MAQKTSLTRRLLAVASLGTLAGVMASACASGGEAETGVGGSAAKSGGAGKDGGAGTAGSSSGGTTGKGGSSAGGSGGSNVGGSGGTQAGGAGGSMDGSAGMAGLGGLSGGGGEAGADAGNGEICDGLDNNGDGQRDEGNPGGGENCTDSSKQGVCRTGTTQCTTGTIVCVTPQPSSEICDNKDNNCNGSVDEGNLGGAQCNTGLPGICQNGTESCNNGTLQCNQTSQSQAELCNGLDDNCDGQPDEGNPEGNTPCTISANQGICRAGTNQCQGGQKNCVQNAQATSESCNNKDDDCNGTIDDPAALNNLVCATSLPGLCSAGKTQCSGGTSTCNPNVTVGQLQEKCDGIDEDCDNMVDDDPPGTMCARNCGIPTLPNVTSMACTSGACLIAQCPAGKKNNDGNYCNGCEATTCVNNPTTSTCGSPGQTVSLNTSNTLVQETGQLVTQGAETWYTVSFAAPPAALNPAFVPTIELVSNASGQYQMDVTYGCAAAQCPAAGSHAGGGGGANIRTWQMNFNQNPSQCGTAGVGACTRNTTVPTNIRVGVRRVSVVDECATFTIKFSQ